MWNIITNKRRGGLEGAWHFADLRYPWESNFGIRWAPSSYTTMRGRIMAPKGVHVPIPSTCECVKFHGKRDFADAIKLRVLRWGNCPGLFWRAQCNHKVFLRGRQGVRVRGDVTIEGKVRESERGQGERFEDIAPLLWRWRKGLAKDAGSL